MDVATNAEISLRMVREAKELSYDTEGSGLDWKRNFPVGYVFCDSMDHSIYVPVRHGGGGNLPDPNVKPPETPTDPIVIHRYEVELAKAFDDRRRLGYITIGHHVKFDCHFSANAGIYLGRNLSCTQNNEALLDEYARSYSLDSCAQRYNVPAKKGEQLYQRLSELFGGPPDRKAMGDYWRIAGDDPVAVDYATGDGITTLGLFHKQRALIHQQELDKVFDLENQLIWTLFRMERRGIRVDLDYINNDLLPSVEKLLADAYQALPPNFNVRSPTQVKDYVTKAGHTDWPKTEKGNPSFDEKWLKTFPEGKHIVAVRQWTNLLNTFVKPLIETHIFEGRVHANINQLKADDYGTPARLSVNSPNLQQIPKRNKDIAKLFRRAFIADEGYEFYEADYSQCEPRLFAHYSKDENLVAGYSQTPFRDVHQIVAEMLVVERDPTAKRMNMGIFTGMFPKTFAEHMGWDIATATEKWNQWFNAFPGVRNFQDTAKQVMQSRGYVRTLLGRRGRLEAPRFAYRAVSKIIQGGNADILKWFMVKLDRFLEDSGDIAHLLMTVHDAFEWQAPASPEGREISNEMLRMMVRVQEPPFNLRVPFVVEASRGTNWRDATFGEQING